MLIITEQIVCAGRLAGVVCSLLTCEAVVEEIPQAACVHKLITDGVVEVH